MEVRDITKKIVAGLLPRNSIITKNYSPRILLGSKVFVGRITVGLPLDGLMANRSLFIREILLKKLLWLARFGRKLNEPT
jgi:hypothetical protein